MTTISRRLALAAGLLAGLAAATLGTPPAAAADEALAERLSSGKLTIGIHNRSPWGFRGEDGKATGYHPDIVRAAFERLGVKDIEFVIAEFGALIPGLNANRFDMIASGIAITPKRCEQVIFSEPDLSVGDGLLVKEGNPRKIHSYADIAANPDIKLAGGRGTLNTRNAIDAGVPEGQILQLQETQALVSAVLAGRADAATISAPTVVSLLQDPNVKGLERATPFTGLVKDGRPAAMYTAIAFRPNDTALRDAYNTELKKLMADGTVKTIMERYGFSDAENAPDLTTAAICAAE
ncbi:MULTISPECIES: ectoine/hydroxyectoine ABC transporter substrate-binding protein EhuB [unclassified Chelatococcus]|uniref:ectoine/hydroxyectoine ABC transporter substrate-binding protein EhuB n=1 Tax=unclassified Chelatococcus TaxID=2638111 RepID=UPI00031AF8A5|nr:MULTISPECIES: ectoine/hydroxyectoine ABC transporter substrate-binding protein EhuB [unclassified Chelatococcus]ALA20426.1 amino acid ABC transporter [Chelatococcus sp. CO-6]